MDIGSLTGSITLDDHFSSVLEGTARKVEMFADGFEGAMGVVAASALIGAAAIAAVGAGIVELGEKGSKIIGVTDAFDRFAETAGTTGEALRTSFSEGLKGTVDEMGIMQSTTKLMSAGMKLTTDQAGLLGEAARALGKATGTDAASGLDTLSSALTTGRTRALAMAGVHVDLKAGEEKFAASIGTTVSQLNEAGVLEGKRIAILDATKAYVDRLGESQLTFAERLKQGTVAVEEWGAKLAVSVASSPHVMAALDAIQGALQKAFGSDSASLLDTIVGGVNSFADAVASAAPYIIDTVQAVESFVKFLWSLRDVIVAVVEVAVGYGAALVVAEGATAAASLAASGYTVVMGLLSGETETFAVVTDTATASINTFALAVGALIAGYKLGSWLEQNTKWGRELSDSFEYAALRLQGYTAAQADAMIATDHATEAEKKRTQGLSAMQIAVQQGAVDGNKIGDLLDDLNDKTNKSAEYTKNNADKISALYESMTEGSKSIDVIIGAFGKLTPAQLQNYDVQQQLLPQIEKVIKAHHDLPDAMLRELDVIAAATKADIDSGSAKLKAAGITQSYIDSLKLQGESEAVIAVRLGVSEEALKGYENQLKVLTEVRKLENDSLAGQISGLGVASEAELTYVKAKLKEVEVLQQIKNLEGVNPSGGFVADLSNVGIPSSEIVKVQETLRKQGEIAAASFKNGIKLTLLDTPDLFISAFTGGGGLSGALKAIGTDLGKEFGTALNNSIKLSLRDSKSIVNNSSLAEAGGIGATTGIGAEASGASFGQAAASVGLSALGVGLGAVTASIAATGAVTAAAIGGAVALGAATAGIGLAAIGAYEALKHIFSLSPEYKQAKEDQATLIGQLKGVATEAEKAEGALSDNYHTIAIVGRDAFLAAGYSAASTEQKVKDLLNTSNPAVFNAAVVALSNAGKAAALVQTNMQALVSASSQFGEVLPESIKASIVELEKMPGLTADEITQLDKLTKDAKPNYDELTQLASTYGVSLEALGPKFQQANIEKTAAGISDAFTKLTKAGGDSGGIILGMSDKILKLVEDARKFGVAIPDDIKPLIESLSTSGAVTDDFKSKLGDVGDISYEDTPLSESLAGLQEALNNLTQTLKDLPGIAASAGSGIAAGLSTGGSAGRSPFTASTGGMVTNTGVEYLASGGYAGASSFFAPKGTDTVATMLTPGEKVTSVPDVRSEAMSLKALLEEQQSTRRELGRIATALANQPKAISTAVKDAAVLMQQRSRTY